MLPTELEALTPSRRWAGGHVTCSDDGRPVGITRHPTGIGPSSRCALCPRPLPRAPTLDKDILVLMMAFWGPSPAATAAGRVGSERIRCRGVLRVEESKSVVSTQEPSSPAFWTAHCCAPSGIGCCRTSDLALSMRLRHQNHRAGRTSTQWSYQVLRVLRSPNGHHEHQTRARKRISKVSRISRVVIADGAMLPTDK
jgi:hypothetical protein